MGDGYPNRLQVRDMRQQVLQACAALRIRVDFRQRRARSSMRSVGATTSTWPWKIATPSWLVQVQSSVT